MATVTDTNGVSRHVFGARCAIRDSDEGLMFEEFANDFGGRFRSRTLFGSLAGNKDWQIGMPTLQGATLSPAITSVSGGTTTFERYVYELFHYNKTTGEPFVYQCPRTDQYYLAEFADERLSYQRMLTKLYSTSLKIQQVRVPGVSVFDPANVQELWAHYDPEDFTGSSWPDGTGNGNNLPTVSGDVQHIANAKGGRRVVRLNASSGSGFISSTLDVTAYDIIAVVSIREATFSNFGGLVTGDVATKALVGDTGETRFYYFAENDPYQYWMNGVEYDKTDMQAPMNTYGIVHIKFPNGHPLVNLQLGKDRDYSGRFTKADLGDVMISSEPMPLNIVAETVEHLATKWSINTPY